MNARKALIDEYKQKKFRIGVYQIRNVSNGKIFVDGTLDLDKIWNRHQFELRLGGHRNVELQTDWNLMGESTFVFEVLSEISQDDNSDQQNRQALKMLTRMFVDELRPFGANGYNGLIKS